jgi:hypothetical protein
MNQTGFEERHKVDILIVDVVVLPEIVEMNGHGNAAGSLEGYKSIGFELEIIPRLWLGHYIVILHGLYRTRANVYGTSLERPNNLNIGLTGLRVMELFVT